MVGIKCKGKEENTYHTERHFTLEPKMKRRNTISNTEELSQGEKGNNVKNGKYKSGLLGCSENH